MLAWPIRLVMKKPEMVGNSVGELDGSTDGDIDGDDDGCGLFIWFE